MRSSIKYLENFIYLYQKIKIYFILNTRQQNRRESYMKVIAIHGNAQDSRIFDKLEIENLETFTLPGHGDEVCIENYSIQSYSTFLNNKIDEDCILLGHSLGGHIALEVATQSSHVKGLISIGAPPLTNENIQDAFLPNPAIMTLHTEEPTMEEIEHYCSQQDLSLEYVSLLKDMFLKQSSKARTSLSQSLSQGVENELKRIEALDIPYFFLYGTKENFINLEYTRSLKIKNYQEISGGHNIMLDNPSELSHIIQEFRQASITRTPK